MPISETACRNAKPSTKPYKVSDGGGLFLLVQPVGSKLWRQAYSKDEMTAHGFRSMASVRLNEAGLFSADAIERQLAHQESDDVRKAYVHAAEFWDERVRMMGWWGNYLDELRQGGKVVPLRA